MWAPVSFLAKLEHFQKNPELLNSEQYMVKSDVSPEILDLFLSRVFGKVSQCPVTKENAAALKALCDELGFSGFNAEVSSILETPARRECLELRNRVNRYETFIERLQCQIQDLERQHQARESELERRLDELSHQFQRFKRDAERCRDAGGASGDIARLRVCEMPCEILSDLSRMTSRQCVFSWLREKESTFEKKLVVRMSSGDPYRMLDPDKQDVCVSYGTHSWIEVEFKEPVRVNGLKVTSGSWGYPRTFDVTFSDGPGTGEKHKVSFVNEVGLNGKNLSVERNFDIVSATLVRIESKCRDWTEHNRLVIGGFELLSPDEACSGGVFHSIFARYRDRFWDCFDARLREFHGRSLHIPNDDGIWTLEDENQWIEVGLVHGRVIVSGYRIKKNQNGLRGWSLRASNDRSCPPEAWTVIHRHREATEADKTSEVLEFRCSSATPFRFFRIFQEEKRWDGKLALSLRYFDVDGTFIAD